jgi:hypothetical protein
LIQHPRNESSLQVNRKNDACVKLVQCTCRPEVSDCAFERVDLASKTKADASLKVRQQASGACAWPSLFESISKKATPFRHFRWSERERERERGTTVDHHCRKRRGTRISVRVRTNSLRLSASASFSSFFTAFVFKSPFALYTLTILSCERRTNVSRVLVVIRQSFPVDPITYATSFAHHVAHFRLLWSNSVLIIIIDVAIRVILVIDLLECTLNLICKCLLNYFEITLNLLVELCSFVFVALVIKLAKLYSNLTKKCLSNRLYITIFINIS